MSSKMARAVRNTSRPRETRLPRRMRQPMEKAMSVAMGMAHPTAPSVPWLNAT